MNCFEITFDNEEVAKENVRYDTIYLYADQDGENNDYYYLPKNPVGTIKMNVSVIYCLTIF